MTEYEKREKVINGLEWTLDNMVDPFNDFRFAGYDGPIVLLNEPIVRDAIALLKEQTLKEVAENYGLTPDGVSFALDQCQKVICEITHGRMSKLSYYADDILRVANEIECDYCEIKEAQEPRLMTPEDFENNPDVDKQRRLPCWVEYEDGYCGWSFVCEHDVEDANGHRFWTSRPTDEQMEVTPWPTK